MELDWFCTCVLKVRHQYLMRAFMNYSACWRSQKGSHLHIKCPTFNTQANRVAIFCSVITKIFNRCKYWMVTFQPYTSVLILCLLIIYHFQLLIVQLLFSALFSYSLFDFIVQYSYYLEIFSPDPGMCSR
jgi:hypothetical protein